MIPRTTLAPGYSISRVIKGGWQLAGGHGPVDDQAAIEGMFGFVDAGITTFDCADIYTGVEALIGRFLAEVRRTRGADAARQVQVHTKYVPDRSALGTLTRADVEAAIDRSRQRLGVDALDLVQFHWWDYRVPGYVEAACHLADLQRAGKIRHVAATNFDTPRLRELVEAGVPLVSHQVQYSPMDRRPTHGQQAYAADHGIRFLCYGTVAGGFVSASYLGAAPPGEPLANRSLTKYALIIDEFGGWDLFQDLLQVLTRIGEPHGIGPGGVAIAWVLAQPGVAAAIVGARDPARTPELARAATLTLSDADLEAIRAVQARSRGPLGDIYDLERVPGGRHATIMKYDLNAKAVAGQGH